MKTAEHNSLKDYIGVLDQETALDEEILADFERVEPGPETNK